MNAEAYSFWTKLGRKISEIIVDDREGRFSFSREYLFLFSATMLLCWTRAIRNHWPMPLELGL